MLLCVIFHRFTCSTCPFFSRQRHRWHLLHSANSISLVFCLSFSLKLHLSVKKLTKLNCTYHLRYFIFKVVIQDFACCDKKIFDILARFSRGFKMELDALLALKCFDPFVGDFSLVLHVFLVAHEHHDDGWLALGHHLVVPGGQVLKGV